MLFIESRTLDHRLDGAARLRLLEELQGRGLTPLIRSTRLSCYERALSSTSDARDMERALFAGLEDESAPVVPGDLFFVEDYALALVFGETEEEPEGLRVSIIYEARTREPLRKLDSFCLTVSDAVLSAARGEIDAERPAMSLALTGWRQSTATGQTAFTRYVARQDVDALYTMRRRENAPDRVRAAKLLEDTGTRQFLQHTHQAHAEGCAAKLLPGERLAATAVPSVDRLIDAGLVRPEIFVSCRQTGHSLFRLPTPDALAVVTISQAACGECGTPVADEKVEEMLVPTPLAAALLEDGSWLVNRVHSILRELGLPESEIAIGPAGGDGEAHMMANVCGEPFLFILRDGPLSPAFARRAIDAAVETQAMHLVVVATGQMHNEGRARLLEHARRRVRSGHEVELLVLEDVGVAFAALRDAFERVSQRVLADQLYALDTSSGLNVSRLLMNRAKLLQEAERQNLDESPKEPSLERRADDRRDIALASAASAGGGGGSDLSDLGRRFSPNAQPPHE